jgi:acetyl-CoA carboxylase carboxyltransferase component
MDGLITTFQARRARALGPPDETADRSHREKGKADARQRIEALVDEGTFTELGLFAEHRASGFGMECTRPPGDGVVTGWGAMARL